MYAVIETGGKQYTVKPSSMIEVNCLNKEAGEAFETDKVLLLQPAGEGVRIGQPYVKNAKVQGVVLRQFRGRKVLVFKQRRRKNYRRTRGHRQELTLLRIERIVADGVVASMPTKVKAKPKDVVSADTEKIAPTKATVTKPKDRRPADETHASAKVAALDPAAKIKTTGKVVAVKKTLKKTTPKPKTAATPKPNAPKK